ncbi:SMI1/KNR4 family protein [Prosthecobacter sp.]|uniref:SMI1/KNR4 family protein n=1 Tax=Prosthecobacter sp. TaxID=1965333 RepID=UPI0037839A64
MRPLASQFQTLIAAYRARGLNNGDGMLPPVDQRVISEAEVLLGFSLPGPLLSIYELYGGQKYIDPGTTGILGRHRLLTPREVASSWQMYEDAQRFPGAEIPPHGSVPGENEWTWWHPALVPFANWDAYHLVICRHTRRIWEYEPYIGLSHIHYRDMDALLEAAMEAASSMDVPAIDFIGLEQQSAS